MNAPTFNGSQEQQTLAEEIFQMMIMQSTFFSADAPIKQTLSNLADFFARTRQRDHDAMASEIDAALRENSQIFRREERDDEIVYVTSRLGSYTPRREENSHMFKQRLYEPENPLPIDDISVVVSTSRPALTTVEPVFISDYWQDQAIAALAGATQAAPAVPGASEQVNIPPPATEIEMPAEAIADEVVVPEEHVPQEEEAVLRSSPDEETISDATLLEQIIARTIISEPEEGEVPEEEVAAEEEEEAAVVMPADEQPAIPTAAEAGRVEEATAAEEPVMVDEAAEPEAEPPADTIELAPDDVVESVPEQPAEPVKPRFTVDMVITLPDGTPVDLSRPNAELLNEHAEALEAALVDSLDHDPLRRIVRFGRSLYPEASLVNLGKNDMRRIRDYIMEVREPLPDTAIIADLYHYNPRQPTYEGFRFSLNYRLSREKDFEFVGVEGARLWSTKGLGSIGTRRIKAGEMAQLTSYLVEGYDDSLEQDDIELIRERGEVTHRLTFFEWAYGVLPFNASLATLFPPPMLADQRSAVLRIESPQHYTSYLVEVRYPTGSRGGWIQGLEEFFHEHLTAGSLITLASTEEPNIFTIAYEEMTPVEDRLLILDEKKNKFAFSDQSYYSVVDEDHLIAQSRFGRLKNLKSLPMNDRRKADMVLKHVFEVAGEQVGTRSEPLYQILMDDLHVAYNVLRPASRSYLRALLESDDCYRVDESLPDLYTYKPEVDVGDEEEDTEEEAESPILSQWGDYDDDEDYRRR
jgi:hypothetical protein